MVIDSAAASSNNKVIIHSITWQQLPRQSFSFRLAPPIKPDESTGAGVRGRTRAQEPRGNPCQTFWLRTLVASSARLCPRIERTTIVDDTKARRLSSLCPSGAGNRPWPSWHRLGRPQRGKSTEKAVSAWSETSCYS